MSDAATCEEDRGQAEARLSICLVCSAYADGQSGQTIVLDALSQDLDVTLVCLRQGPGLDRLNAHISRSLLKPEEDAFYLTTGHTDLSETGIQGTSAILNRFVGIIRNIGRRSEELCEELRSQRFAAVIGCSGDHADLPVAADLARRLDVPFIAYLFDDPVYQWTDERLERPFTLLMERDWVRRAAAVLVPNEELGRKVFARNEDLEIAPPIVLRNPVERADASFAIEPVRQKSAQEPWVIAYTGSVYHAQADAFRNLVEALDWLDEPWELHVASHQNAETLRQNNLGGPHVHVRGQLSRADSIALQRQADVLFLPLAFDAIPDVIRTSAPLKTGEYLASGRPILVHAPEQSWLSRFFRARGCGFVVDQPQVPQLAAALLRLREDAALRRRLVDRQLETAREFSLESARRQFRALVERRADGCGA